MNARLQAEEFKCCQELREAGEGEEDSPLEPLQEAQLCQHFGLSFQLPELGENALSYFKVLTW